MVVRRSRGGDPFGGLLRRIPPTTLRLMIATVVATLLGVIARNAGRPEVLDAFLLRPREVVPGLRVWQLLSYLFIQGTGAIDLLLGLLVLYFFGSWFERRWGSRRFLFFFVASGAGAGAFVVLLGLLSSRIASEPYYGIWAVAEALTVALGVSEPDTEIYLYLMFPMKARNLMFASWVLLGLFAVFAGSPIPYLNAIGGAAMGGVLTAGFGGPRQAWLRFRASRIERELRRRARHLKVVPPTKGDVEGDKKTYLH
jgi:membrane associated rhomboid family serine protease